MDLFKSIKDLKSYTKELAALLKNIEVSGTKVKIGEYKIVETPSDVAASRLVDVISSAVESEYVNVSDKYLKFEAALNEFQTDLFEAKKEVEPEENTLKFGSKVQ